MIPKDLLRTRQRACLVVDNIRNVHGDSPRVNHFIQAGWNLHILVCGEKIDSRAGANSIASGIEVIDLNKFVIPTDYRVADLYGEGPAERSERLRQALEQLQRQHHFGVIEFTSQHGSGARTIQAKRAGLSFSDAILAVRLDGNSQRDRERNQRWPGCFAEVEEDFLERFSFEEADIQYAPDQTLTAFVRQNGWRIQPNAASSVNEYEKALREFAPAHPTTDHAPLVTIGIAYHNLGRFFPDTLRSIAAQTYPNLEVIAIDDGSTDTDSVNVFEAMRERYPMYRFLKQANAGVSVTRNQCLSLAEGEYFVAVDADNLARPDMIARFVGAMQRNRELAAMTCYLLGFNSEAPHGQPLSYLYALRPSGGPHALAGIRNVYGDGNAIFRTSALRAIGGYEIDRGTATEDWEVFVKLIHGGYRIGVVPDHLFYYRHRAESYTRTTNWFANHQRVLRQFASAGSLSPAESLTLWTALLGFHQRLEQHAHAIPLRRHRIADRVAAIARSLFKKAPRSLRRFFLHSRSEA